MKNKILNIIQIVIQLIWIIYFFVGKFGVIGDGYTGKTIYYYNTIKTYSAINDMSFGTNYIIAVLVLLMLVVTNVILCFLLIKQTENESALQQITQATISIVSVFLSIYAFSFDSDCSWINLGSFRLNVSNDFKMISAFLLIIVAFLGVIKFIKTMNKNKEINDE